GWDRLICSRGGYRFFRDESLSRSRAWIAVTASTPVSRSRASCQIAVIGSLAKLDSSSERAWAAAAAVGALTGSRAGGVSWVSSGWGGAMRLERRRVDLRVRGLLGCGLLIGAAKGADILVRSRPRIGSLGP